ncbi:MAG: hypothetical protein ACOC04_05905 [Halothece sp.]
MDQCLLDYWLPLRIEHWCDLGEESLATLAMRSISLSVSLRE